MVKDCPCCKPPLVEVKVVLAPKACCDNSDPVTRQDMEPLPYVLMEELQPTSGTHHQATLENSVCSKHPGPCLFANQPLEMRTNAHPWNCTASTRFVSHWHALSMGTLCGWLHNCTAGPSKAAPGLLVLAAVVFSPSHLCLWGVSPNVGYQTLNSLVATPFCQSWCQSGECGAVPSLQGVAFAAAW